MSQRLPLLRFPSWKLAHVHTAFTVTLPAGSRSASVRTNIKHASLVASRFKARYPPGSGFKSGCNTYVVGTSHSHCQAHVRCTLPHIRCTLPYIRRRYVRRIHLYKDGCVCGLLVLSLSVVGYFVATQVLAILYWTK